MKNTMMKNALTVLLIMAVFFAGCAGREANLVQVRQLGDEQKTCDALLAEMYYVENEISRLLPKSDKTGKNIALGATGIIFIIPLFFMDLKQGEKKEIEAYRQRYNHLLMITQLKDCKLPTAVAEETETINQKEYEEYQRYLSEKEDSNSTSIDEASASTNQAEVSRRLLYLASHPVSEEVRFAILNEMAAKGMTKEELIAAFGEPNQIIKTEKHEQFVYDNRKPKSYYFKGGILEKAE